MKRRPCTTTAQLLTTFCSSLRSSPRAHRRVTFPGGFGGIRLDYLFVSGESIRRVGGNKVLHEDTASDHFPMVCEVEL